MAALPKPVKVFIVTQLARFEPQKDVLDAVKTRFGIEMRHQHMSNYDPSTQNGQRMSDELKNLFAAERKAFLEDIEAIPIANKSVRLRMLERAATSAEKAGNRVLMAALIKQAAEEVGNVYTNRQDVNVKGKVDHVHEVSDAELVTKLAKFGISVPMLGGPASNEPVALPTEPARKTA